jgi:hypothetical protein
LDLIENKGLRLLKWCRKTTWMAVEMIFEAFVAGAGGDEDGRGGVNCGVHRGYY